MRTSPCRGCGQLIEWHETASGKFAPFDLDGVTSHFATCPKAADFRKPKATQGGLGFSAPAVSIEADDAPAL